MLTKKGALQVLELLAKLNRDVRVKGLFEGCRTWHRTWR